MSKIIRGRIIFLVAVSLALGCIYFLPNILIPHFYNQATGGHYAWHDMAFYVFEEAFSYGVIIKDIIDGHFLGGDPYLWEYKDMATSWDYYPLALAIGLFFKILHLKNLGLFFVINDFIFPPASFVIIFFLFYKITKNYFFSILSSLIFLFFPNIFMLKKIFSTQFLSKPSFLNLSDLIGNAFTVDASRIFVPAITMIFLGAFLLAFYYSISEKNIKKKFLALAGISYGLLFYIYFYYWVFSTVAIGFLGIICWFYKKEYFWRIIRIFSYGLIVSIPYWARFLAVTRNPIYGEIQERIGLLNERMFMWPGSGYWTLIFLFSGVIFWKRIKNKILFFYTSALLMTTLVVRNLQVIVGFNPQPDHWESRINVYIIIFSALVSIFFIFGNLLEKHKTGSKIFLCAAILSLLAIAVNKQVMYSIDAIRSGGTFLGEDIRDSFEWINENAEKDAVFATNAGISRVVLAFYTHANSYLPHACLSLASNSEIEERYAEIFSLYEVPPALLENQNVSNDLQKRNLELGFFMFCETNSKFFKNGGKQMTVPPGFPRSFIEKYEQLKPGVNSLKYRADYIFYGPFERITSNFRPDIYPELKPVYRNDSVVIYKILK